MRRDFIAVALLTSAWHEAPWAAHIVRVDGGFLAFESIADFHVWSGQR